MESPNFIIIGAMKSGTTSIFLNLIQHPKIYGHPAKEINFFSEKYQLGTDWYINKFRDGYINGESSPNYSKRDEFPEVAARIKEYNPNIKIIYVVRDPLKRLISHLHHDLYRDRLNSKHLDETVLNDSKYLNVSNYYYQIEPFLDKFERNQIHFVKFEDYLKGPEIELNKISSFLGLNAFNYKISGFNTTEKKYLIKKFDLIKKLNIPRIRKLYHAIFYILNIKIRRPELSQETVNYVNKELEADISRFYELSGISF